VDDLPQDPGPEMTIQPAGWGLWKWVFTNPRQQEVIESAGAGSREACVRDAKRFLKSRGLDDLPIHFKV
jgi:hypothetical protein